MRDRASRLLSGLRACAAELRAASWPSKDRLVSLSLQAAAAAALLGAAAALGAAAGRLW